jgi:hypothetical protein
MDSKQKKATGLAIALPALAVAMAVSTAPAVSANPNGCYICFNGVTCGTAPPYWQGYGYSAQYAGCPYKYGHYTCTQTVFGGSYYWACPGT